MEEAGEVGEGQLVAALPPSTRHLVLVGDHLQLRPVLASRSLVSRLPGADTSLLERLLAAGLHHCNLGIQHRMAPALASLLAPLYPGLRSHPVVEGREGLPGLWRNTLALQLQGEARQAEGSWSNWQEAELVARLVARLEREGVRREEMVVLTPYTAQVSLLHGLLGEGGVEVATVDSFQGREQEVVLLSLVRSAPTSVGFLTCPHRAAVALSRARRALLIIGDLELLSLHSQVWRGVRDILQDRAELVEQLEFTCRPHGTVTRVSREEDCRRHCSLPCRLPLPCRHPCSLSCHSPLLQHSCSSPCQRSCHRDHPCSPHPCPLACSPCMEQVLHRLPCGHSLQGPCHQPHLPCPAVEQVSLQCGHTVAAACGRPPLCTACTTVYRKQEELEVEARVHRVVGRDREPPEHQKVMVDQELVLEIVEMLEGGTSLPDWLGEQDRDREVLTVSLVSALASWTGSDRELVTRAATSLQPLLQTSSRLQLLSLYSLQESRSSCLLHWFMALYQEDSVQEEVFLAWRDELNTSYNGKGEALVQVNRWLTWLQEEETEDEDEWG